MVDDILSYVQNITLMHAMKQRGKQLDIATLCGGGGVSMACTIEML
jgi:acetyl-CoA C-acetyltransferase